MVVSKVVADKAIELCESGLTLLTRVHPGRITARAFIRGALVMLGEGVKPLDEAQEFQAAGGTIDEEDFEEIVRNCQSLIRKAKESLSEDHPHNAAKYLKSIHRLLGSGEEGSGSLTPRPKDYAAAMSRFAEDSLSSPSRQRLPSFQEHPKTHSGMH